VNLSKVEPYCKGGKAQLTFYFNDPAIMVDSIKGIKIVASFYKYNAERTNADSIMGDDKKMYYLHDGYTKADLKITSSSYTIPDNFFWADKFALR
jgi:hypothetical protein